MRSRQLLLVALVFVTGLAAWVGVSRYAIQVPASMPAAKPSVREQIVGRWQAVADGREFAFEVGPDDTLNWIDNDGKPDGSFSFRWIDDENIEVSADDGRKIPMRIVSRNDHLAITGPDGLLLLRGKRPD